MGTYVLSVCFFNFIAGFVAAVYMHNPRLLRWRRKKAQGTLGELGGETTFQPIAFGGGPNRSVEWNLPDAWRDALVTAHLPLDAAPETVMHGVLYWHRAYRKRMLDLERKLRAADQAERVDDPVHALLDRIAVSNRDLAQRLREASKLNEALEYPERDSFDDHIFDYIMDIESDEITPGDLERELKAHGLRERVSETRRVVDAGHPFRDYVERLIAERQLQAGTIAEVPDHWQREAEGDVRNRVGFYHTLDKLFESETEPFQICSIHFDRFRQINERIGLAEGDELLKAFAALLRDLLGVENADDRLCRLFGATLCVFMPKTDRNGAEVTAERIRQAVEASSIVLPSGPIECTVSCGIIEAFERQSPLQVMERLSPIIHLLNQAGGNRTGVEVDGEPVIVEPRAFQVEARVVQNGEVTELVP